MAYRQMKSCFQMIHLYFRLSTMLTLLQMNYINICINKWAFQWKMSFNPYPRKQAQEIIFIRKIENISQPSLHFSNIIVSQSTYQEHLGIFLDARLTFKEH